MEPKPRLILAKKIKIKNYISSDVTSELQEEGMILCVHSECKREGQKNVFPYSQG